MKPVEFWFWNIESETRPGKRIKSVCPMTREDALRRDPKATPIPGTCEVRQICETIEEERRAFSHDINTGDSTRRKPADC